MSDAQQKPETKAKTGDAKIVQGRSPAYPYCTLEKALERAEQVRAAGAARGEFPPETFYKLWELGPMSSAARQTMAALNHYGLVDYIGRGDARKVKLSELAIQIVMDKQPNSAERKKAVGTAALTPDIHRTLFDKYGALLPADVVLQTYLCRDMGYNEEAAKSLIDTYRATLSYAGLDKPGQIGDSISQAEADAPEPHQQPVVGSFIQWTNNGADQFPQPREVISVSDDGNWLWVTGSQTAIPIKEVTVMKVQAPSFQPPPPPPAVLAAMAADARAKEEASKPGSRRAVFPVDGGDVTLIFPEDITKEGLQELGLYLDIFLKKEQKKKGDEGQS